MKSVMNKNVFYALLIIPFITTTACVRHNSSDRNNVYRVALRYIPETTNPYTSQIDTDHFIMLQLYYPLFQRASDGSLESAFLDITQTKALDSSFQNFMLCLRSSAQFSDGSAIQISDLEHSLREAHKRQELLPVLGSISGVSIRESCIKVALKTPDPRYFEKLTGIASTVTSLSRSFFGFPLGLGPYHIAAHTTDKLTVEANSGRVKGSFKTIEFTKYTDVTQDYANGVFDFNHTGQVTIPPKIKAEFQNVSRPFFKSYSLVVNYPLENVRKRFMECFPVGRLRSIIGLSLTPTEGFLPVGLQGSSGVTNPAGTVSGKACAGMNSAGTGAKTMTFFNYRPEIGADIRSFLKDIARHLPISMRYEEGSVDGLVKKIFNEDSLAAVIGFDSSTSDSSAYAEAATFFESFIRQSRSERLITQPVSGLNDLVKIAAQAHDLTVKTAAYRKAHQLLLDSGYVVPLGQLDTSQYYPKVIRHIMWSDRISGFPDISLMEVRQ